jgi:hypothetical protein
MNRRNSSGRSLKVSEAGPKRSAGSSCGTLSARGMRGEVPERLNGLVSKTSV